MTFQTYLKINGTALPVQKDDYSVDYSDVIADSCPKRQRRDHRHAR